MTYFILFCQKLPEIARKLLQIARNCPKFDYFKGKDFSKKFYEKYQIVFKIFISHKNAIKMGTLKSKNRTTQNRNRKNDFS